MTYLASHPDPIDTVPRPELDGTADCRVLVVDDDAVCLDIVHLMLDRLGYHADTVVDGVDAFSAVHAAAYDVVLMDVQMPGMDGMTAARLIRAELDSIEQPIIVAMTADTTPQCQEQCLQAGMDGRLRKPLRIDDLAATLENRLLRHWKLEAVDPGDPDDGTVPTTFVSVVYDAHVLESLLADLGADGALRADLIDSFLDDLQERLAAVSAAGDATDTEALAFQSHAIKSTSATIGFLALSEVAAETEAAAKSASGETDVGSNASLLAAECQKAINVLTTTLLAKSSRGDWGGRGGPDHLVSGVGGQIPQPGAGAAPGPGPPRGPGRPGSACRRQGRSPDPDR